MCDINNFQGDNRNIGTDAALLALSLDMMRSRWNGEILGDMAQFKILKKKIRTMLIFLFYGSGEKLGDQQYQAFLSGALRLKKNNQKQIYLRMLLVFIWKLFQIEISESKEFESSE